MVRPSHSHTSTQSNICHSRYFVLCTSHFAHRPSPIAHLKRNGEIVKSNLVSSATKQLQHCTTLLFHYFTISPFHHFTISPFHHFTISLLHYLTSNRSNSITFAHATAKSFTNFSFASSPAYTSANARNSECDPKMRSARVAVYFS